jgi:hypothetical protein
VAAQGALGTGDVLEEEELCGKKTTPNGTLLRDEKSRIQED